MNCTRFRRSAAKVTNLAVGMYSVSHGTSRSCTWKRAAPTLPGGGMWTSSRARNTTVPNTLRIGCEKLPAVYCVTGVASGKPQSHGADRRSLRDANRSVKLGALLYLLVLGYAYVFAFLMVKTWSGLTPARVEATYLPTPGMEEMPMQMQSHATTKPLDLGQVPEMQQVVAGQSPAPAWERSGSARSYFLVASR